MTKIIEIPILAKAKDYRDNLQPTFIFGGEEVKVGPDLDKLSDAELVMWFKGLHQIE